MIEAEILPTSLAADSFRFFREGGHGPSTKFGTPQPMHLWAGGDFLFRTTVVLG